MKFSKSRVKKLIKKFNKFSIIIWFLSVITFYTSYTYSTILESVGRNNLFFKTLNTTSLLLGIFAYLSFLYLFSIKKGLNYTIFIGIILIFGAILLSFPFSKYADMIKNQQYKNSKNDNNLSVTPAIITIIPTSVPQESQNNITPIIQAPTVNPDLVVKCWGGQNTSCKDKYIHVNKSSCTNGDLVCCQLSNNYAILSKNDCNAAHTAIKQNTNVSFDFSQNTIVIPTTIPTQSVQNIIPSPTSSNIDYQTLYNNCVNDAWAKYNNIMGQLVGAGTADSSYAIEIVNLRNSSLGLCENLYGN